MGERNSEVALLCDAQRVEHELAHAIHMSRSTRYNFLHSGFGQCGECVSPVVRVRAAGDPTALLEADHDLRHPGLAAVALSGQVAEAKGEVWGHGEAGENAVFVVRRLGVAFQLPVEQRRERYHDGEQVLPHRLLVLIEPSGRIGHDTKVYPQLAQVDLPRQLRQSLISCPGKSRRNFRSSLLQDR